MFLVFYGSCVEQTCRIYVLKRGATRAAPDTFLRGPQGRSLFPWTRSSSLAVGSAVVPGSQSVSPYRCFWVVPLQLAPNLRQVPGVKPHASDVRPKTPLCPYWGAGSEWVLLSMEYGPWQQVDMQMCVSIFCCRLELACVTKQEQSAMQIFSLWKLSSDLASTSGKASSFSKSSLNWKLKNCSYSLICPVHTFLQFINQPG